MQVSLPHFMPRQSLIRNGTKLLRVYLLSLSLLLACQMRLDASNCRVASSPVPTPNPHGSLKAPCENCHTPVAWMPIRKSPEFDHNKTRYPLRGLHTKLLCQECHIDPVFTNVGRQCQDCHADLHRRKNGAQCDLCHRVNGWQVSVHNINEHQDRFPLIGAHAVVDCYSCHKVGTVGQFNRQSLSTECISCHLKAFQKATSPNHQALGFSMECRQCHNFDSWRVPASAHARWQR